MSDDARTAPRPKPSWAVIGIFLILAFAVVFVARSFLMPLALTVLLFFVFSPICRLAARFGVPQWLSSALVCLALLFGFVVAAGLLSVPIATALDNAPLIVGELTRKLAWIQGSVGQVNEAVETISELSKGGDDGAIIAQSDSGPGILTQLATTAPSAFGQGLFALVLLFFALSSREALYRRTVMSFAGRSDKRRALAAMHEIEDSLGRYLGSITVINACLGIAVGCVMWLWGMPTPALIGVAAFAFNFVPYVGALAGVLLTVLIALVTMEGLVTPLLVGLSYKALTSIEGNFVTPYFVSQRLRLNAVVVLLSVALFAWLWSVVGMVVAVPMLIVLNAVCAHVPALSGLGAFLSDETDEDPSEHVGVMPEEELPETYRGS